MPDTQLKTPAAPAAPAQTLGSTASTAAQWEGVYRLRTFRPQDAATCRELYTDGLLGGNLANNDTGLDIDDIAGAYLSGDQSHFWVVEVSTGQGERAGAPDGTVVGMIGVQHHDAGVGEIRRLRVHRDHRRRRIGSQLLEAAVRFCRDTGCLKVALDTYIERDPAIRLFERFRFRHGKTRQVNGKDMLYFYLDLYSQDHRSS